MIKYTQKVSDYMNKGFITSALLYGILSLFLVLVLNTVAVVGNRKIAIDKLKQSALEDVQDISSPDSCFEVTIDESTKDCTIEKYIYNESDRCSADVYIPRTIGRGTKKCTVTEISDNAFKNLTAINTVTISHYIEIGNTAFSGCSNITFILKRNINLINGVTTLYVTEGAQEVLLWGSQNAYVIKQG